ncbi:laminin G domain-containing protein [Haloarcula virus HVTV-2]|uniref:LamG-like jellyroll fold domain-containing protein n=1 Tax=Haloarcula vallismortis tailed virus 1 TaxID=1262528 RepID=L7TI36_9CAUD|nr:hypothetical protein HVTV1_137 [Haloarcula vallismortis tailed virus 1]AGC34506.1 hypothetical protein HVTV1_137 [Haloarcula vallismortis tailed virus 1]UBF22945.1 laminin G domain-containing protein [Haloarcula virus HVTV-2]
MTLDKIGDIANPTLTDLTTTALTWGTASDWDGAADEAGVVHEAFGPYPAADQIQLGYPSFDRGGSGEVLYWTLDEASGDAIDHFNSNDGTVSGFTRGGTGLHNGDCMIADSDSDEVEASNSASMDWETTNEITIAIWYRPATGSSSNYPRLCPRDDQEGGTAQVWQLLYDDSSSQYGWRVWASNSPAGDINVTSVNFGSWDFVCGRWDGSDVILDVNGTKYALSSPGGSLPSNSEPFQIGFSDNGAAAFGRYGMVRAYDRALSDAEVTALYDAGTGGYLESATKSVGSQIQPDITDVQYTLNGESIDLKVIGSPGTASEEIVTQSLTGAASYTLTWSNSHSDFRVRPEFSTSTVETSPIFNSVTIEA